MRGKRILGIAVATAAFAAGAVPASAAPTCHEVDTSSPTPAPVTVCFDLRQSGTTVAPWVETTLCVGYLCGTTAGIDLGATGFTGGGKIAYPTVDPDTLTIRWPGGHLGSVWVDGQEVRIALESFCAGACFER